ncbi:hypothetical protein BKA80DRAFT_14051 [Phyllosticta citrichinensis]
MCSSGWTVWRGLLNPLISSFPHSLSFNPRQLIHPRRHLHQPLPLRPPFHHALASPFLPTTSTTSCVAELLRTTSHPSTLSPPYISVTVTVSPSLILAVVSSCILPILPPPLIPTPDTPLSISTSSPSPSPSSTIFSSPSPFLFLNRFDPVRRCCPGSKPRVRSRGDEVMAELRGAGRVEVEGEGRHWMGVCARGVVCHGVLGT